MPIEQISRRSAADRAKFAQALFRGHRNQPDGGAELAKMFRAAWLGSHAPEGISRMGVADLPKLWRRQTPLIWHARRNNEMIAGVMLRALGWPLKLVFTSAAQRHHSWMTRWLIRRMDAIIATIRLSASFLKRRRRSSRTASTPIDMRRRSIAPRHLRKPRCRAATRSAASAACARKRAAMCSSMRCAGCCRAIRISQPSWSGRSCPSNSLCERPEKRIEAAGLQSRIVITGELAIEEVQRWYQRLTIYAFTSRNEGFGLTLIEAMAAGARSWPRAPALPNSWSRMA